MIKSEDRFLFCNKIKKGVCKVKDHRIDSGIASKAHCKGCKDFKQKSKIFQEIKKYGVVSVVSFILTTTFLFIFVDVLGFKAYIMGTIYFAINFFLRFFAEKYFVFRRK